MTKDERAGGMIARKVIREMLSSTEHRQDIDAVAERYVENAAQARSARKYVRVYCRHLLVAMRMLP